MSSSCPGSLKEAGVWDRIPSCPPPFLFLHITPVNWSCPSQSLSQQRSTPWPPAALCWVTVEDWFGHLPLCRAAGCLQGIFSPSNCKQSPPSLARESANFLKAVASWGLGLWSQISHCFPSWFSCDVSLGPSAWLHRWAWMPSLVLRKQKAGPL